MFIHVAQGPFISTVADHGTRQGDVFCETEEPKKKRLHKKCTQMLTQIKNITRSLSKQDARCVITYSKLSVSVDGHL